MKTCYIMIVLLGLAVGILGLTLESAEAGVVCVVSCTETFGCIVICS